MTIHPSGPDGRPRSLQSSLFSRRCPRRPPPPPPAARPVDVGRLGPATRRVRARPGGIPTGRSPDHRCLPLPEGRACSKILIANRGEIAVRVVRACRDAGYTSVAVYAEPDRDLPHVRMADEAYALDGSTPADTYLDIAKLLAWRRSRVRTAFTPATASCPRTPTSPRRCIDAGLTWIGPSPQAIRDLGDKVVARHIALRAGAPLVRRHQRPGLRPRRGRRVRPRARGAGGDQGRVRRRRPGAEDRPHHRGDPASCTRVPSARRCRRSAAASASWSATSTAPGTSRRRCWPTPTATSIVVGTRDCSLQRRNQKLVEEAPAPFLTDEQRATIHTSAKAICREAGYSGAGTVEYLVGNDGVISFLEVNTRLQVEHPVSEETAGHRPGARAVPHRRGRDPALHRGSRAARPRLRVPDQRRGPGPQLPARAGHRHRLPRAGRPGRPGRLRRRGRHRRSAAPSTRCWPS